MTAPAHSGYSPPGAGPSAGAPAPVPVPVPVPAPVPAPGSGSGAAPGSGVAPGQEAARLAPGRDRYLDLLRALALVRVVFLHMFAWTWLPIVFPSMGVMFALAAR
ncbi:hypothetical protein ACFQ1I_01415 [Kitasatospora arboriphila]